MRQKVLILVADASATGLGAGEFLSADISGMNRLKLHILWVRFPFIVDKKFNQ